MIISDKHKYLFIAVPHTASTAISNELINHYDGEVILYKHANYFEFIQYMKHQKKEYSDYFVFAAVRNPLDSSVTNFRRFATNHMGMYTDEREFERNGGWITEAQLEKFHFVQSTGGDYVKYLNRYHRSVYHNWNVVAARRFGYVMRYESIASEFGEALKAIGLEPRRELPFVNRTDRRRDFASYYPKEAHELAARTFGPFMLRWNYAFPPDWSVDSAPASSRVRFEIEERAVEAIWRLGFLDPQNRWARLLKKKYYKRTRG